MNEFGNAHLTPEEEDPALHRVLLSLPSFAPREGFADRVVARLIIADTSLDEAALDRVLRSLPSFSPSTDFQDRVMARVYRPIPDWMQRIQRAARSVLEPRRRWAIAGGLAALSTTSMAATFAFVASRWDQTRALWSWFTTDVLIDAWRATVLAGAAIAATAAPVVRAWGVDGYLTPTVALGCVGLCSFSAMGLVRTVRGYRRERATSDA